MAQKPMTKTQLVAALAEKTDSDKASVNRMLEAWLSGQPVPEAEAEKRIAP